MADIKLNDGSTLGPNPDESMLTVTEAGMPVEERITTVQAARSLYKKMYQAWLPTAKRRSRLKGLVDGNPPFENAKLVELGLGYMTNINFLEARGILDQKAGAFYELFFEVPTLVEVKQKFGVDPSNPLSDYGPIVAEEFSKLLLDWKGFLLGMLKARREADVHGFGVGLWRDEWDWRPEFFSNGNFLTDLKSALDVDKLNFFFVRDMMTAGDLYRAAIKPGKIAESEGWDIATVKRVLTEVYIKEAQNSTGDEQFQTSTWEAIQQSIRNNDYWTQTAELEQVRVVHMLVKEIGTGSVSHYIFPEKQFVESAGVVGEGGPVVEKFMFRQHERYDKMSQVLWLFFANDGDGFMKSVRGLASMIEPHCDLSNRFLGRVFDAGFMTSSLVLKPATAVDVSRLQLVRMGLITVVPPGLDLQQSSFMPQIGSLVQIRELSTAVLRNNTGVYKQVPEAFNESMPAKTARQVMSEETKEARLEKSSVAFDYSQIQELYREMFRRATKKDYLLARTKYPGQVEARAFIGRCILRGVPEALLYAPDMFEVSITRAIGMGSWSVKMDISNQILSAAGKMDQLGGRNAFRDWIAVRVGRQNVDRYAPPVDRNQIPSNDTSVATLENDALANGQQAVVGNDQGHMIHALVHVAPIVQVVQQWAQTRGQGMNIQGSMAILGGGLPHLEGHLQILGQDSARVDFVKQMAGILKAGVDAYKGMAQIVMQAQNQAAAQAKQQMRASAQGTHQLQDAQMQQAAAETSAKFQLEKMKQDSLNAMRAEKTAQQLEIARTRAAADLKLKAERQAAELAMNAQKADADIAIRQAKAGA